MSTPKEGDPAPDFELPGTGGETYRLSDFKGKKVVIAFYPGDETPVCTRQLCSYRDAWSDFEAAGVTVLGISPQTVKSHERFREHHGFPFPLLADAWSRVAAEWGLSGLFGRIKRSVFAIDEGGVVRYAHVSSLGLDYRKAAEILARLDAAS